MLQIIGDLGLRAAVQALDVSRGSHFVFGGAIAEVKLAKFNRKAQCVPEDE